MNLSLLILLVIFAVAIAIALSRKLPLAAKDESAWPFYAAKPLTEAEQVLYHRLVKSLPECIVLAQVQLSRVLSVKKGFNFHEWNNRINRMSLDFVICLKDSTIVAAIELDDKTHEKSDRKAADAKKEKALAAAGIPLIRWHVSAIPDVATIRMTFVD